MDITVIRSNAHRLIAAIFESTTKARAYNLDNYFEAHDAPVAAVKASYERACEFGIKPRFTYHAEETTRTDGSKRPAHYTIHYHSNCWVELDAPSPAVLKAQLKARKR